MAHLVKCLYCGKEFNRDKINNIKIGNRYAHAECYDKRQVIFQKDEEKHRKVTDLIKELGNPSDSDWGRIGKQLHNFINQGMTYDGIYYSLVFFCYIKKNKFKGIGIVPYIYNEAKAYYDKEKAVMSQLDNAKEKELTQEIVILKNTKPKKKLIDFNYED